VAPAKDEGDWNVVGEDVKKASKKEKKKEKKEEKAKEEEVVEAVEVPKAEVKEDVKPKQADDWNPVGSEKKKGKK